MAHIPIQMAPLVPMEHGYQIACRLLDWTDRTKLGFRFERYNASKWSRDHETFTLRELGKVIDWAEDKLRKYPATTVEFEVIIQAGPLIELAAVDHFMETLCFIPGWTKLVMSFDIYPINISSSVRGTFDELFARRGIGQLMFAFDGKSVEYRGPQDLVPAPWFHIERLSRFFVGRVDVLSNVHPVITENRLKANAEVDWRVLPPEDKQAKINVEFLKLRTQVPQV
ncbi:hypothetical protein EV715DRAFT_263038 [Schizophyllum commune]